MNKYKIPLFILVSFIAINIVFNFHLVEELFNFNGGTVPINDGVVTEFLTETIYQNILHFRNPFEGVNTIFYPYQINYALNDTSATNVLFLFFLRPIFDIHRSTLLIVFTNFLFAEIFMYALLRKIKVGRLSAYVSSLVFSFTPFLSYRVQGHYTYTVVYFFPLLFLLALNFLESKKPLKKTLFSFLFSIFALLLWFANPYYFIMGALALIFYCCYFLFFHPSRFIQFLKQSIFYLAFTVGVFLFFMTPWVKQVYELSYFESQQKINSFNGALELSGDIINFILPSEYNPFYRSIIDGIASLTGRNRISHFFYYSWGRFIYPGILIIATYAALLFFYKKLKQKWKDKIRPHLLISFIFAVFSLGPFLKVFNRWQIMLEGVPVVFPLPFLLLHYFPGFSAVRAPARFIAVFVFFACIVGAFFLNSIFFKLKKPKRILFFVFLLGIFFVDQLYVVPRHSPKQIPLELYRYINKDTEKATVLEIPFTVRDGLEYTGFVHATSIMRGVLLHKKPIIGGYLSRVHPSIFTYYRELPFIGHIAQITDKGNYVLYKESPKEPLVTPFTVSSEEIFNELNFLDIKYVILKRNEKYTSLIRDTLIELNFKQMLKDQGYTIYMRKPIKKDFMTINFGSKDDYLYLAENFGVRENSFRWALGKSAQVFVKTYRADKRKLYFTASSFYKKQKIRIYLNSQKVGALTVGTNKKRYMVNLKVGLKNGINTITFVFSQSFRPSDVFPSSRDMRDLSVKFYQLYIQ